jgi:hypothetical protein
MSIKKIFIESKLEKKNKQIAYNLIKEKLLNHISI